MNLGVFLPNWVGDAAMATPALRALRKQFPADRIVGIARPAIADVLAGTPWLDDQILFDPRSGDGGLHGLRVWRALRRQRLETIVLLTNSFRTALWARLSGARRRIGYARSWRSPLLTDVLQPPRWAGRLVPSPVLNYYLELAYALGCPPEPLHLELATLPADEAAADHVWEKFGLPAHEPVVVLNSGGAFGAAKLWPTPYFAALARRIAVERGLSVLAVCGPAERRIAAQIVQGAGHPRVVGLADEPLSIGLTKACIRRAGLLVSTDSGPRHFAAAFNVPVITLFGPTHVAWSENHHPLAVHLRKELDCSPCQRRTCPLGHHRCLRDLSPDEVFHAVEKQLTKPRPQAA